MTTPLTFAVRRRKPEFITPNKPTSHEQKIVSDIDDQASLRFQMPFIFFYRYDPSMEGKDPAEVIKDALAQTLVLYYPFAGRLREGNVGKYTIFWSFELEIDPIVVEENMWNQLLVRKCADVHNVGSVNLIVDCNEEGVMFIKADADVTLEQFGEILEPPFPCFDQLLCDFPHSQAILNCPLLLIQVTRLKCGGFIVALRFNHVMCDGMGLKQFMSAIGEMARGLVIPSILPVWERHLLDAQDPPKVAFAHHEYDQADDLVEPYLWRCRTIAMDLDPDKEVRMLFAVNARSKFNPPLPSGYYGNAFAIPAAMTTVRNLRQNPLGHAVELVQEAKASMTEGYVKSVAALMTIRKKQLPLSTVAGSYGISDLTNIGFQDIDFGWGKAVFAGPAKAIGWISLFIPTKNKKGEVGTSVPICLPAPAMERFAKELDNILKHPELGAIFLYMISLDNVWLSLNLYYSE
ncbi:hypothetical protein GQ457_08G010560 [Hibiscus cannabinus]